jgi:hypothetical protein
MTALAGDALSQVLWQRPPNAFSDQPGAAKFSGLSGRNFKRAGRLPAHLFLRQTHVCHDLATGAAGTAESFLFRHYLRKARLGRR